MKCLKAIMLLGTVFMLCSAFNWKFWKSKKSEEDLQKLDPRSIYMAGVSASFVDSLVYFTEIQLMDSVYLNKKGFLPNRDQYSQQLKDYLETEEGLTQRVCFVYFSRKHADLMKKISKMKAKYQKGNTLLIRQVNPNTFSFKRVVEENNS